MLICNETEHLREQQERNRLWELRRSLAHWLEENDVAFGEGIPVLLDFVALAVVHSSVTWLQAQHGIFAVVELLHESAQRSWKDSTIQ